MSWSEIDHQTHDAKGKGKHHFLSAEGLSKQAKERIKAKRLEDQTDAIYSLALQNVIRIIGVREGATFYVVWYDPKHEFYPSKK